MPLCRYTIRNEFSLADGEVYKAADKNDPEALLEGFAMAGLAGVLRQLGDLAEFAAEVFSDLHNEVAATAVRSHGVMVRVQHLERELPLVEKAFLEQTNHFSFFYRAGIDWHPNMHTEQNCITKGDLPLFIAHSYEESRGPPRFILLDKFDIGGAGACLKRYTNPSFYTVEAAALGTTNSDHGENKSRKSKRGTQRNGRTPKALLTPDAKLHQLLLEEKVEHNAIDPAGRVRLKRRLNGFPLDSKTGKSYMKKILKDCSPEHELLREVVIGSVASNLEVEVERHCNGSECPDMPLTYKNPSEKTEIKNAVSNIFRGELDFKTSDGEHYDSHKPYQILVENNSPSNLHVGEKKIIVDRENKAKARMAGYQSDDVASEVEIYIDTLASKPQLDSDPKLVVKTNFHVSSNRKQVPGVDVTKSTHQADFPDSQSIRSSTLSDDEISSLKKCISTSYNDGVSRVTGSLHLEAEVSNEYQIGEISEAKRPYRQLKWNGFDAGWNDLADNLALRFDNSEKTVSNGIPSQRDEDGTMGNHSILKVQMGGLGAQDLPGTRLCNDKEREIKFEQNVPFNYDTSTTPFQGGYGCSLRVLDTKQRLTNVEDKHPYMHECLSCVPNISDTSYSRRASKDQDMEELDDEEQYLDPDDGALVNNEDNLSTCFPKCQLLNGSADEDSNMAHPAKLTADDLSLKELTRDVGNEASGMCIENQSIRNGALVHVTPEVSTPSLDMPQGQDDIDYCKASPAVSQIHSPITSMPPEELPLLGPRLSEWEIVENQHLKEKQIPETAKKFVQASGAEVGTSSILMDSLHELPNLAECRNFGEFTSIAHLGERGDASYRGSFLGVNLSDTDVERDKKELSRCKVETGVSKTGDEKLFLKSHLKQTGNSKHFDKEGHHIISASSFLKNLKNEQTCFEMLTQGNATITDVGGSKVPLGSISPVFDVLPEAFKINLEEVPPPPPFPPVQGRMGRNQPMSLTHVNEALSDNKGLSFSQSMTNRKTPQNVSLSKDLPLVHDSTSGNSVHDDPFSSLVHLKENPGDKPLSSVGKSTSITRKLSLPAKLDELTQHDDHMTAAGDTGHTHDLAAMKQQKHARLRNPLIDTIFAHDKTKLKKVTERTGSKMDISDGRDSLLEQIRAKAFNLKPIAVQRPSIQIQGPTTNLRVAAILEKAKTIRHAFSGSDEDDDSWSD